MPLSGPQCSAPFFVVNGVGCIMFGGQYVNWTVAQDSCPPGSSLFVAATDQIFRHLCAHMGTLGEWRRRGYYVGSIIFVCYTVPHKYDKKITSLQSIKYNTFWNFENMCQHSIVKRLVINGSSKWHHYEASTLFSRIMFLLTPNALFIDNLSFTNATTKMELVI